MEIMNCPKRISLIMQKAQSPQEDSSLSANSILPYIEGHPKEEMKLYPKSDLKNRDRFFDFLQESFGKKRFVPSS